jgi:hypothetical protein
MLALLVLTAGIAEPKPLWDGKTFDGWEGDTKNTWRIENDTIVAGSLKSSIPRNEFLCTKEKYADFELKLKFRLLGAEDKANAGVQFRTERIPNHHEVVGYQADIGQGYWGALYDESRRKKVLAGPSKELAAKAAKIGEWNDYIIRAEGPKITLTLNGFKTTEYTEEDATVAKTGVIALQIHGGPACKVFYKDLFIEVR